MFHPVRPGHCNLLLPSRPTDQTHLVQVSVPIDELKSNPMREPNR